MLWLLPHAQPTPNTHTKLKAIKIEAFKKILDQIINVIFYVIAHTPSPFKTHSFQSETPFQHKTRDALWPRLSLACVNHVGKHWYIVRPSDVNHVLPRKALTQCLFSSHFHFSLSSLIFGNLTLSNSFAITTW